MIKHYDGNKVVGIEETITHTRRLKGNGVSLFLFCLGFLLGYIFKWLIV